MASPTRWTWVWVSPTSWCAAVQGVAKSRTWLSNWTDWFTMLLPGPLEKKMATHLSILAWRIPWTEEPGGIQSKKSQSDTTERLSPRGRAHTHTHTHTHTHKRGIQACWSLPCSTSKLTVNRFSVQMFPLLCRVWVLGTKLGGETTWTAMNEKQRSKTKKKKNEKPPGVAGKVVCYVI